MYLIFVLIAVFLTPTTITISAKILDACQNNFGEKEIAVTEEWFKWGRLHSYCMQYGLMKDPSVPIDPDCTTDVCKQCMRPCSQALSFNLKRCLVSCGRNKEACENGCRFYEVLYKNGNSVEDFAAQNITVDLSNVPNIVNKTIIIENENYTVVDYRWNQIDARSGLKDSPTIYFVTFEVRSPFGRFQKESSLYLTTDVHTTIDLDTICNNIPSSLLSVASSIRINVYPINQNGYNRTVSMQSSYHRKELPAVLDVIVGEPYCENPPFGNPRIVWDVTPLWHKNTTFVSAIYQWSDPHCEAAFGRTRTSRKFIKYLKANRTRQMNIPVFEDAKFANCTATITFESFSKCLPSPIIVSKSVTYGGCNSVKDALNCGCGVTTTTATTTPIPPPKINITVKMSAFKCPKLQYSIDEKNKSVVTCEEGNYNLAVFYEKPDVHRYAYYVLKWGIVHRSFNFPVRNRENRKINSSADSPYVIGPFEANDDKWAIRMTVPNDWVNSLRFKFFQLDQEFSSSVIQFQSLEWTMRQNYCVLEAKQCFENDTSLLCGSCKDGTYKLEISWTPNDEYTADNGYEYTVRWGDAVTFGKQTFVPTDVEYGTETTNDTSLRIDLDAVHFKLGVQVYAHKMDSDVIEDKLPPIFGEYVFIDAWDYHDAIDCDHVTYFSYLFYFFVGNRCYPSYVGRFSYYYNG